MNLDIHKIKTDFPILNREVRPGTKLVYLDSTATAQKPSIVIDSMKQYYEMNNANIHFANIMFILVKVGGRGGRPLLFFEKSKHS